MNLSSQDVSDDQINNNHNNNQEDIAGILLETQSEQSDDSIDDELMFPAESPVVEISGLQESSNGRNCTDHVCCGMYYVC